VAQPLAKYFSRAKEKEAVCATQDRGEVDIGEQQILNDRLAKQYFEAYLQGVLTKNTRCCAAIRKSMNKNGSKVGGKTTKV